MRKPLLGSIIILLAVLTGYNLLIAHTSRKSLRQQFLTRLAQVPKDTDCLFLGNSLVEAGCDSASFESAWPDRAHVPCPINLALGATTPVEHELILRRVLKQPLHLRYLIYGFFDDQLNAPVQGQWSELVGNRALSYYFPKDAAELYAPGSRLKKWQLVLTYNIPMLAERSSLWGKVELLRRAIEDIGMPKHKTNRFGRVDDFAALEPKDMDSFNERCQNIIHRQSGFSTPIQQIIALARQRGVEVILLEMPMPGRHRQSFYSMPSWTELRTYVQALANQEHAVYLSAGDWMPDEDFEDATHLNQEGSRQFSAKLAMTLAGLRVANAD
jgi:hypothetical protein